MADPTIVVAGFGRCGSSLVMQMLFFGGLPCVGRFPAFEDDRVRDTVQASDIAAWAGSAVKVLDPHRVGLPGDVRVIWLDRDPVEQSKSHAKFLRILMGQQLSRDARRATARGYLAERRQAFQAIGRRPVLVVKFEALLAYPRKSAERIAAFVGGDLNIDRMTRCVMKRSPKARPDLLIETALLNVTDPRSVLGETAEAEHG